MSIFSFPVTAGVSYTYGVIRVSFHILHSSSGSSYLLMVLKFALIKIMFGYKDIWVLTTA